MVAVAVPTQYPSNWSYENRPAAPIIDIHSRRPYAQAEQAKPASQAKPYTETAANRRLVPGNTAPRNTADIYRRRRAAISAALALGAVAVALVVMAVAGPHPASGAGTTIAAQPAASRVWVVQEGDTLWGIVKATGYKGDPRVEVQRLSAQLHGRPLQVGERIRLR